MSDLVIVVHAVGAMLVSFALGYYIGALKDDYDE